MYSVKQSYSFPVCLVGVEKVRVSDLDTILSIDDIKTYLAVDISNTAVDSLITELRESAFDIAEDYTQRSLGENSMIVNYTSLPESELLPFAYATTINSISVDGDVLDASDYSVFSGRIVFTNKVGYQAEITISYSSTGQVKQNMLTTIKRLIGVDYDNTDVTDKHSILKMLRADKIRGWI